MTGLRVLAQKAAFDAAVKVSGSKVAEDYRGIEVDRRVIRETAEPEAASLILK